MIGRLASWLDFFKGQFVTRPREWSGKREVVSGAGFPWANTTGRRDEHFIGGVFRQSGQAGRSAAGPTRSGGRSRRVVLCEAGLASTWIPAVLVLEEGRGG